MIGRERKADRGTSILSDQDNEIRCKLFRPYLLAQPALQADVATTLGYAVLEHGAVADKLQTERANWTVQDLADEIGNAR